MTHRIVSEAEWLEARKALLAKEKEFTRLREELAGERRALPWVKVEKNYVFEAREGKVTLADLFDGKGQLIVQHFMFGPDWNEGCPSCSFWTDNFNGIDVHLAHRDTAFVLASRAPIDKLEAYAKRMGWNLRWVSSLGNDFNFDFAVSFPPDEAAKAYNFGTIKPHGQENPGLSAFRCGDDGAIYRTYSTYARGLDMLNGTYQLLDITSKGRDEDGLPFTMSWLRRHDRY
ncbi:MAG: DUF899 domain-containing protein [Alphaproteobacteria bacterium]|jgi:predicted dithiol-disulfide oxidoreductase (DUF899 family)|nr:MAG: DUF899 domain-containing protein [Alphaproteobacteria bacterium]